MSVQNGRVELEKYVTKTQTRNMNNYEKIILIQESYDHVQKYCALNKTKFWAMIFDIFKQQTGYYLVNLQ